MEGTDFITMQEKILIVDDEKKIVKMIRSALEAEGYITVAAYDGEQALDRWREEDPDLVVLDTMMPRLDGYGFCENVREESAVPIIFLTARAEEEDKLEGFGLGGDDYLTKPFSPRELVARIRSLLRRREGREDEGGQLVEAGPVTIDTAKHRVQAGGKEILLTPAEFKILLIMVSNPGNVYSRRELMKESQGEFFEGYERTVDTHIWSIRKKAKEAVNRGLIDTIEGVGYRFAPEEKD